jgi:hypothetical protein|tara:strand:+ start:303 stop:629 length:327 start_codon:yes stop_codon:yes gene_type:complete
MSGLLHKLVSVSGGGSPLSKGNGITPPTPIGATPSSQLQFTYSINGNPNIPFNGYFTHYQVKPTPSELDIDGVNPVSPLAPANTPQFGSGFSNGTYKLSCPTEGVGNI